MESGVWWRSLQRPLTVAVASACGCSGVLLWSLCLPFALSLASIRGHCNFSLRSLSRPFTVAVSSVHRCWRFRLWCGRDVVAQFDIRRGAGGTSSLNCSVVAVACTCCRGGVLGLSYIVVALSLWRLLAVAVASVCCGICMMSLLRLRTVGVAH